MYILQIQILTSFHINILALGTGASYGIANVLLSKLDENNQSNNKTETPEGNMTNSTSIFHFTINMDEASWIGMNMVMLIVPIN